MKNKTYIYYDDIHTRIDKFLSDKTDYSRTYLQKLFKTNNILVNNKEVKKSFLLNYKDKIEIIIPEVKKLEIEPQNIELNILYEDENFIAVDKPFNMTVHPANKNIRDTLVNALLSKNIELSEINGIERPGIVHRLDKDTSGIIIVAKNNKFHTYLSNLFKERKVSKTYIAVVHNSFNEKSGIINLPVGRSQKDRKKMAVVQNGRESITEFNVIFNSEKFSIIKVYPKTGRTHQIRVHLRHINHPVVMDKIYIKKNTNPLPTKTSRLMLHAYSIKFFYPKINNFFSLQTEIFPVEFNNLFKKLKLTI